MTKKYPAPEKGVQVGGWGGWWGGGGEGGRGVESRETIPT